MVGLLIICGGWTAGPAPKDAASVEQADTPKQAARVQVRLASTAFANGDYAVAIEHYEAAMALLPAPKLHYNIGVCHQRLSLEAQEPESRTLQRDLAIESYNAYLAENPRAEDRLEVAAVIRELGGSPVTMPTLKPLFEGADASEAPGAPSPDASETPSEQPEDSKAELPSPPPAPAPPPPRHGRFGVNLFGGTSPTFAGADQLNARALFALDLLGGGMLGPRRRFLLAAHTQIYFGTGRASGLPVSGYSLGLLGQQNWVLARDSLLLGAGAIVGVTGQSLGTREDVEAIGCRLDSTTQTARRTGALLTPRFELGILLGARRRGIISLSVQPGFAVHGDGPTGVDCEPDQSPWTALGVRRRWQFQLMAGAGFGFRF